MQLQVAGEVGYASEIGRLSWLRGYHTVMGSVPSVHILLLLLLLSIGSEMGEGLAVSTVSERLSKSSCSSIRSDVADACARGSY